MKKLFLWVAAGAACLLSAAPAGAQMLKTNVLAPVSLYYEQPLSNKISVQIGGSYSPFSNGPTVITTGRVDSYRSFSVPLEMRYYFDLGRYTGSFIGPFVKYRSASYNVTRSSGEVRQYEIEKFGVGIVGGQQKHLPGGLSIEVFGGLGIALYNTVEYTSFNRLNPLRPTGIVTRYGLCIGYAFGEKPKPTGTMQ